LSGDGLRFSPALSCRLPICHLHTTVKMGLSARDVATPSQKTQRSGLLRALPRDNKPDDVMEEKQ
jgi:hypothetical protein